MYKNSLIMNTKQYTYKLKRTLKDGTPVEYDCVVNYESKGVKRVITDEDVVVIKQKLNSGITKKRVCQDHGISFTRLQAILAN